MLSSSGFIWFAKKINCSCLFLQKEKIANHRGVQPNNLEPLQSSKEVEEDYKELEESMKDIEEFEKLHGQTDAKSDMGWKE